MTKREEILSDAKRCVSGGREADYGSPESNLGRIARLWSDYLNIDIKPEDVSAMMILLKVSRIRSGHAKDDNWIDIAGYAAIGGEVQTD